MKIFLSILFLTISSCSVTPEIISQKQTEKMSGQTPKARVIVKDGGWGWILWYVPIAAVVCMWGYREFVKKSNLKNQGNISNS